MNRNVAERTSLMYACLCGSSTLRNEIFSQEILSVNGHVCTSMLPSSGHLPFSHHHPYLYIQIVANSMYSCILQDS